MEGLTQTYKNNIRGGNTPMLKLVEGVKKAGFLKTINTKVEDKFFCVGFYLTLYIGSAPKDNLVSFWTLDRPYVAIAWSYCHLNLLLLFELDTWQV